MSDNQEIKKLLVVGLAILVLIGAFIGFRACTKSDKEEVEEQEEIKEPTVTPTEPDKEEETVTETSNEEQPAKVVQAVSKKEAPVVTLKQKYSVDLNGKIELPEVTEDDKGNKVKTEITIEFLPFGSVDYESVKEIDTSKLGTYKVTYKFTNEDGVSSSTVITIEIVDNEKPNIYAFAFYEIDDEDFDIYLLEDGDHTNCSVVGLAYEDNDEIAKVEYYKVTRKVENGSVVVTKELTNNFDEYDLTATDGEYYVKAYDRSGNVSEFSFVLDREKPDIADFKVTYNQVGDSMIVTITSDPYQDPSVNEVKLPEKMAGLLEVTATDNEDIVDENGDPTGNTIEVVSDVEVAEDWELSEDETSIEKTYADETTEDVIIVDKAGNTSYDTFNKDEANASISNHIVTIDTTKIIKVEQPDATGAANVAVGNNEVIVTTDGSGVLVTINRRDEIDGTTLTATAKINDQVITLTGDETTIDLDANSFYDGEGEYVITYEDDLGNTATFTIILSNS